MVKVTVDEQKCTGCGNCVGICPGVGASLKADYKATDNRIRIVDGVAVIKDDCPGCGLCIKACPMDALSFKEEE